MTDLEISKLCAEATSLSGYFSNGDRLMKGSLAGGTLLIYDPLHDDNQCMALIKMHPPIAIYFFQGEWVAKLGPHTWEQDKILNRAVCQLRANMQNEKKGGGA